MFYALSKNEDYIFEKVNLFVACAPVARMQGVDTVTHLAAKALPVHEAALGLAGYHHVFDEKFRNDFNEFGISDVGQFLQFNDLLMLLITPVLSGAYTEPERIQAIRNRFPNEASTKEIFHYAQLMNSGKFQEYDYGYV